MVKNARANAVFYSYAHTNYDPKRALKFIIDMRIRACIYLYIYTQRKQINYVMSK
jgi:hypothetical protein